MSDKGTPHDGLIKKALRDNKLGRDVKTVLQSVAQREHWAEEYECAMMHLSDLGVPKDDGKGNTYSLVGRIDKAISHPTNDAKKVPDSAHGALPITREYALSIGFKEQPIFTIDHGIYYDVGRRRTLNIGDVGTPNEMLYLCETNEDGDTQENDVIVLHNYDYDGQLSDAKLNKIISFFEVCKPNEQEDEENE